MRGSTGHFAKSDDGGVDGLEGYYEGGGLATQTHPETTGSRWCGYQGVTDRPIEQAGLSSTPLPFYIPLPR